MARTDFTVLIEGESGVGKELVARQIHELEPAPRGPFVAVNCAAIVETLLEAELFGIEERTATGVRGRRGKFEHAHGGTLFLDEVSDLSLAAQAKLLRAIQDLVGRARRRQRRAPRRHADHRRDERRSRAGRAGAVPPRPVLPAERRRRRRCRRCATAATTSSELARYFLERHRASAAARCRRRRDALLTYDWPGNVRELERVIERAVALAGADVIELDDLPPALLGGYADVLLPSLRGQRRMRAWGSRYARLVLERCKNNKRQACRGLDISYHTLQAYLRYTPKLKAHRRRDVEDPESLPEPRSDGSPEDTVDVAPTPTHSINPSPMEATLVAE